MKKEELKKNIRVWCWWKSRYYYYSGYMIGSKYKFVDICDCIELMDEDDLSRLEIK